MSILESQNLPSKPKLTFNVLPSPEARHIILFFFVFTKQFFTQTISFHIHMHAQLRRLNKISGIASVTNIIFWQILHKSLLPKFRCPCCILYISCTPSIQGHSTDRHLSRHACCGRSKDDHFRCKATVELVIIDHGINDKQRADELINGIMLIPPIQALILSTSILL